ncbi:MULTISPECIES: hypothetical protein [unclassified Lysobacter]|uniref:hypothetical protein n=1 Tax=unclassified Lysobacter TaxID=2635362 RepID=UPI001BE5057F|nr:MULTISPECIES: hypothetical protein [unclassified Lysobacter]MBT2747274.1 hypothetical protein [Lysobacter sp. ISL-42]MBT2753320.1 hypothetical protein [Lysobacter sp. ISL-50]MBT2775430.1 hypothetical protein [Lysobacter sp. ISL-54]MBT2783034.1 hypothetical protein [Lysobacter sp. ISL-52]
MTFAITQGCPLMPRSPSVRLSPALLALVVSITAAFAISPASAAALSNEQAVAALAHGCWSIRGADDDGVARRLNWQEAKSSPSGLFGEIRRVVPDPREPSLQLALTNRGSQLIMAVLPDGADGADTARRPGARIRSPRPEAATLNAIVHARAGLHDMHRANA